MQILEVLDTKPLIDTNCLRFAKYDSNHLFVNPRVNDTICSTEYYDPQYQKPYEGQQKYHKQSYHHLELYSLKSGLTDHTKLNNAAESQTEGNI